MPTAEIIPHTGLTLLAAYRKAKANNMVLVANGNGDVRIAPQVFPGWREIPLRVKVTAPNRGCVCTGEQVAA